MLLLLGFAVSLRTPAFFAILFALARSFLFRFFCAIVSGLLSATPVLPPGVAAASDASDAARAASWRSVAAAIASSVLV